MRAILMRLQATIDRVSKMWVPGREDLRKLTDLYIELLNEMVDRIEALERKKK